MAWNNIRTTAAEEEVDGHDHICNFIYMEAERGVCVWFIRMFYQEAGSLRPQARSVSPSLSLFATVLSPSLLPETLHLLVQLNVIGNIALFGWEFPRESC